MREGADPADLIVVESDVDTDGIEEGNDAKASRDTCHKANADLGACQCPLG